MDLHRAIEISKDPELKDVTYEGDAIYIQQVHEEKKTAIVHPIDDRSKEMEVSVSELEER